MDELSSYSFESKRQAIASKLEPKTTVTRQNAPVLIIAKSSIAVSADAQSSTPQKAKPAIPKKTRGLSQQSNLESGEENDEFSYKNVRKKIEDTLQLQLQLQLQKDPLTQNSTVENKEATSADKNSSAMSEETGKRKETNNLSSTKESLDELSSS